MLFSLSSLSHSFKVSNGELNNQTFDNSWGPEIYQSEWLRSLKNQLQQQKKYLFVQINVHKLILLEAPLAELEPLTRTMSAVRSKDTISFTGISLNP